MSALAPWSAWYVDAMCDVHETFLNTRTPGSNRAAMLCTLRNRLGRHLPMVGEPNHQLGLL